MNNTTDNFWNDDLVKEYTHDVIIKALNERTVSPRTWDEQILKFKQSKLQQQKEEHFCILVREIEWLKDNEHGTWYSFSTNEKIDPEKYNAVKKAISDCLNEDHPKEKLDNPFFGMGYSFFNHPNSISITKEQLDAMMEDVWNAARDVESFLTDAKYPTFKDYQQSLPENKQEVEDKEKVDWEIQCIQKEGKNYWIQKDGYFKSDLFSKTMPYAWFLANGGVIHSVLRKSDGEVFTVGDEILVGGEEREILDFWIPKDKYCCHWMYLTTYKQHAWRLQDIVKLPNKKSGTQTTSNASLKCQNEEKKPLFTTDDVVDIFKGDDWWSVKIGAFYNSDSGGNIANLWEPMYSDTNKDHIPNPNFNGKRFSTKENAEKYILHNKPQFTFNEIRGACEERHFIGVDFLLEKLVNQKINQ